MSDTALPTARPAPATAPATTKVATNTAAADKKDPHRDPVREAVETIVFVVVLVLLLKMFVTEAFVIPTGSMAETLYGYQKVVECPQCGFKFPVNSHEEVEGRPPGNTAPLLGCTCPNCRFSVNWSNGPAESPPNRTGDRVLVLKPAFHLAPPARGDVVVFKYPKAPQENGSATNYIKRAMAFGGETVAIFRGELFATRGIAYPDPVDENNRPIDPKDLWERQYMFEDFPAALEQFQHARKLGFPADRNGFAIVRKTDEQVLACRRIVWDNDHQPKALRGKGPSRWYSDDAGNWTPDDGGEPKVFTHAGESLGWLRYRHEVPQWTAGGLPDQPPTVRSVVTNFLAYNTARTRNMDGRSPWADVWVGDLTIECEADVPGPDAEVVLELSRGVNRFQARFAGGQVTLVRTGPGGGEMGTRPTPVAAAGKYHLRFANVDSKLRVWVNEKPIDFGTEGEYAPVESDQYDPADTLQQGWTAANDLNAPASVGAKGGVAVRGVKLFHDIYYTSFSSHPPVPLRPLTYYVQPGHYLCLGDNSASSSDSRDWGVVPERLMLGKAVFVFWPTPLEFPGPQIWNVRLDLERNRTGVIR